MRTVLVAAAALTLTGLTACSGDQATAPAPAGPAPGSAPAVVVGDLMGADGQSRGKVEFHKADGGLEARIEATGLTPGFHGLHLHKIGKCEPGSADPTDPSQRGDFNSSGGHLDGSGSDHPGHDGDLPALQVGKSGKASMRVLTDRLTVESLADADGSAFVVHEKPDNYANIPTRYAPNGPDAETKKAGDAGKRIACAALKKG